MKLLMLCSALLIVMGCSRNEGPVSSSDQGALFGIYFLKDSSITEYQANQVAIDQLGLKDAPWLREEGIEFYDFSSHCIYLKGQKADYFEHHSKFYMFEAGSRSRPFVVVANHQRCYVGAFHSGLLSSAPSGPYMDEMDVGYYPVDVMHISKAWTSEVDVRKDSRIQDALNILGLYHGGISVHLDAVTIIENSDTSTVEYGFRVTNEDRDRLVVIDPDKMGTELFHYYTNGVVLHGNGVIVQSTYKKVTSPTVTCDPRWLTELQPNESISRTVTLRGYSKIAPGIYTCSFTFADPVEVEKGNRYVSGGRVWLGKVESNGVEVTAQ